jgi:pimeloyl-ACP methyl ester carboxylesterase
MEPMDTHQIDAGLLSVGYAESGPSDGPAVLLLHGWPYDIHSYADVAPMLAAKGYRVIAPFVRASGRHGSCRARRCGMANHRPWRPTWSI